MSSASVVIRKGDRLDVQFLRSLLGHAYNWHVAAFDTDVAISRYVDGWGRRGDTALIAMEEGHPVGAGWYRLFPETIPGYGFVDAETPEVTIVVLPSRRGEGIGSQLLDALVARARADGYGSLSVSVERGKLDAAFFLDRAFQQVSEHRNTLVLRRML